MQYGQIVERLKHNSSNPSLFFVPLCLISQHSILLIFLVFQKKSGYFFIQHSLVGFYNRDRVPLLRGTT